MIRCEAERSGDGSDSGSAAIRESARLHLRVDVRVHLDVSPRLEALVARLLAALGRPGAEVADSGAVSAPRMVETAGAAVRDAPSPIDTERPEPVIPAAPAEPSPDLVPSAGAKHAGKRGGFNTPARDAIIAEGWPRGDPAWVMLDTINALPGRPFRDTTQIGLRAWDLHLKRPPGHTGERRPKPDPAPPARAFAPPPPPVSPAAPLPSPPAPVIARAEPFVIGQRRPVVLPEPGADGKIAVNFATARALAVEYGIDPFDGRQISVLNRRAAAQGLPEIVVLG